MEMEIEIEAQGEDKDCLDTLKSIEHFTEIVFHKLKTNQPYRKVAFICTWKDNESIYIHNDEIIFHKYFKDYFDVINMLDLNGAKIYEHFSDYVLEYEDDYRKNIRILYCHEDTTFYYKENEYKCTFAGIREELKDVIDEILSKNKAIINQ